MSLACGHEPSPHDAHTTGTAVLPDGKEICWSCSDAWVLNHMAAHDKITAYMSQDGQSVTTWNGTKIARITRSTTHRIGFYRTERVYFRATDETGKKWHGQSAGPCMSVTMRSLS